MFFFFFLHFQPDFAVNSLSSDLNWETKQTYCCLIVADLFRKTWERLTSCWSSSVSPRLPFNPKWTWWLCEGGTHMDMRDPIPGQWVWWSPGRPPHVHCENEPRPKHRPGVAVKAPPGSLCGVIYWQRLRRFGSLQTDRRARPGRHRRPHRVPPTQASVRSADTERWGQQEGTRILFHLRASAPFVLQTLPQRRQLWEDTLAEQRSAPALLSWKP